MNVLLNGQNMSWSPLTLLLPSHPLPKSIFFLTAMTKHDLDIQKILFPIKRCLMVISNYGMNFRPGHKQDQTQINFLKFLKWKMETLPLKKSKLFSIFFLRIKNVNEIPGHLTFAFPKDSSSGVASRICWVIKWLVGRFPPPENFPVQSSSLSEKRYKHESYYMMKPKSYIHAYTSFTQRVEDNIS